MYILNIGDCSSYHGKPDWIFISVSGFSNDFLSKMKKTIKFEVDFIYKSIIPLLASLESTPYRFLIRFGVIKNSYLIFMCFSIVKTLVV